MTSYKDYFANLPPERQAAIKARADELSDEELVVQDLVDAGFEFVTLEHLLPLDNEETHRFLMDRGYYTCEPVLDRKRKTND